MNLLKKLYDMRDKKKSDNKGFSLVELIIVIAIMAILVGIVGMQVIPYIEKSRKAKDTEVLSGLCTDATTAYASTAAKLDPTATYEIKITAAAAGAAGAAGIAVTGGVAAEQTALKNAFTELNGINGLADLKLASKAGKDVDKITITCSDSAGVVVSSFKGANKQFDDITSK